MKLLIILYTIFVSGAYSRPLTLSSIRLERSTLLGSDRTTPPLGVWGPSVLKGLSGQSSQNGCDQQCIEYLIKYGYVAPDKVSNNLLEVENMLVAPPEPLSNRDVNYISHGLINLQKDACLPQTGIMDDETIKIINTPRCGVLDHHSKRQKRFAIVRKWDTTKNDRNETMVSWYLDLSNYNQIKTTLTEGTIRTIFATAFSKWSNTSLLYLHEVQEEDKANITIKFLSGNHGDGYNFDGPGQVLAHAFFPGTGNGGDVHFDLAENWTLWNEDSGTSLYNVAIHEIGHSLGLSHSTQNDSMMYAWYNPKIMELGKDDILGINYLYGVKTRYKFVPLDPKHRIYRPYIIPTSTTTTSTTPKPTTTPPFKVHPTTKKYRLNKIRRFIIQNSSVYVYPKSPPVLSF